MSRDLYRGETDPRIEVLERDGAGRPTKVAYRLRYVTRILEVGLELEGMAPSDADRKLRIRGFSTDGADAWPYRFTSRRSQHIAVRTLATRYVPRDGFGRGARWRYPYEVRNG